MIVGWPGQGLLQRGPPRTTTLSRPLQPHRPSCIHPFHPRSSSSKKCPPRPGRRGGLVPHRGRADFPGFRANGIYHRPFDVVLSDHSTPRALTFRSGSRSRPRVTRRRPGEGYLAGWRRRSRNDELAHRALKPPLISSRILLARCWLRSSLTLVVAPHRPDYSDKPPGRLPAPERDWFRCRQTLFQPIGIMGQK